MEINRYFVRPFIFLRPMTIFFARGRFNPFSSITGIFLMLIVVGGLFLVAIGTYWLLSKIALFLLVGALLVHYQTVTGFLVWIWNSLNQNIFSGLVMVALTVILHPFVVTGLFFKALLSRKLSRLESALRKEEVGDFVDFEELESTLRKKDPKKSALVSQEDRYTDLFE